MVSCYQFTYYTVLFLLFQNTTITSVVTKTLQSLTYTKLLQVSKKRERYYLNHAISYLPILLTYLKPQLYSL